jgi:hypothetical protein
MSQADLERLVKQVIVEHGFGCTLLSVSGASTGWNVMVRTDTGGVIRFTLLTQRAVAARVAIAEILEAEL